MSRAEIEAWASAWIEAQQDPALLKGEHPLWWSVAKFMLPLSDADPEDCWAAGPLEDLVHHHGQQFIECIELEARRNPIFRYLLGGVWESGPASLWARIQKAQGALQ